MAELISAMVGKDEVKIAILTDPEHPYINATTGQCFNHVITSFSKACIVSKAVSFKFRHSEFTVENFVKLIRVRFDPVHHEGNEA